MPDAQTEDDDDWIVLENYDLLDHSILIEGTSGDKTPEDPDSNWNPDYYQVVFRSPWQILIGRSTKRPNFEQIKAALNITSRPPELMKSKVRISILEGFISSLNDISKQRGFCIACGLAGAMQHNNDSPCALERAMRTIHK